jgi:toxin ParE1/3/4
VPQVRLTRSAEADLARILAVSAERWGIDPRRRYEALLFDAIQQLAVQPEGPLTRKRSDVGPRIRSFHVRQTRREPRDERVRQPVHVIYYRPVQWDVIEIVRVLHERMEPREAWAAIETELKRSTPGPSRVVRAFRPPLPHYSRT